ncbi:MAG: NADP-dependent phosphogluconate dehydrogenase [Gammaproteobacteria bacterium]|nr:NADP-dependent phosphogluconate dehydrogenase [Gammaproteobacteria bacterium]
MTEYRSMGVIGLGVMGCNLALNMAEKGYPVVTFDPWEEARSRFAGLLAAEEVTRISITQSPVELIAALPAPRAILIMVKAGEVVDRVIDSLLPGLTPGDILIDGGNSHYLDTVQREDRLRAQGFHFVGLGVSGGEEGARHGPSLMAGGASAAYDLVQPVLEAIAARFDDAPCCALVGADGAGHFVKMIHNGIEYGVMQLIAEGYVLLRDLTGLGYREMAKVFRRWNETELASYLIEITAGILAKEDDLAPGPLVEKILDKAGQKGTGRWSSEAALELGIPTPTITEAVFARALASLKEQRVTAAKVLSGPAAHSLSADRDASVEAIRQALLGTILVTYAQGLAVVEATGTARGWTIELGTVAAIWRSGCIIRADLLDQVMRAYGGPEKPINLMCAPAFANLLATTQEGWRNMVAAAVQRGIPVPGISSSLAYYDGYRSPRLWANLIQAQRDCFGAHTYERIDRPGTFHTRW